MSHVRIDGTVVGQQSYPARTTRVCVTAKRQSSHKHLWIGERPPRALERSDVSVLIRTVSALIMTVSGIDKDGKWY